MTTKNLRYFFLSVLLSFGFWWATNVSSQQLISKNFQLTAQVFEEKLMNAAPAKKANAFEFTSNARSALSVFFTKNKEAPAILFEKDSNTPFPIASITKLMTALVAVKNYSLNQQITFTKQAIEKEEDTGNFKEGETFSVLELLDSMLIESSNDASEALVLVLGKNEFIGRMNDEALSLKLSHTYFVDSAGTDPALKSDLMNISSAADLFVLTKYILEEYPQIFSILNTKELNLYTPEGAVHHHMVNTNKFLGYEGWGINVLGGKTGWTPEAKGNLVLAFETNKGYVINIVLGSDDRFYDMKMLTDWIFQSYDF